MAIHDLDRMAKIFSNSLRVDIILQLLSKGELTLSQVTAMMQKSKSAMSRQMKQLVELDMVEEIERDLNNPGSPQKAYRISSSFMENFVNIRDKNAFFEVSDMKIYISYIMGMLAVSKRMNALTMEHIKEVNDGKQNKENPDVFVDMGILLFSEDKSDEVKELVRKFVINVQNLSKNVKIRQEMVYVAMFPYEKMLSMDP